MFAFLRRDRSSPVRWKIPDGQRAYAIGDIHGRLDLLETLLRAVEADNAARPAARTSLVFLGDLIDRGPESAGVVRRVMRPLPWAETVCLKGNHEAAMVAALAGDAEMAEVWLRVGGDAALASWGVDVPEGGGLPVEAVMDEARRRIPEAESRWIADRPMMHRIGDYLFVHAGIRPGTPIEEQGEADCLWIREPFLNSRADHGVMVVHGHSIREAVEQTDNRIGIDTGAYFSGMLTALGLEGEDRWVLAT